MFSAFLAWIQIFASYWSSTLLFFFPGIITYKHFALLVAIISSLFICREISRRKAVISRNVFLIIILGLVFFAGFFLTRNFYGGTTSLNESYFLVYAGQTLPGIITAAFISTDYDLQDRFKKYAPIIAIVFTIVSLVCTLFPTSATGGGYATNDNSLTYQTLSYMAAFASGLSEYTILLNNLELSNAIFGRLFSKKTGNVILYITIAINFLTVLLSGGRGGFVLFFVYLICALFLTAKMNQVRASSLIKAIGVLVVLIMAGYITLRYALHSSLSTNGISRITELLSGGGDSSRSTIRKAAFDSFLTSPIIGHGIGSVFFEIGGHSHNFITDALVETGIIGTLFMLFLLIKSVINLREIIHVEFSNVIWVFILLAGVIPSMFSGYYLASLPMWWIISFAITTEYCTSISEDYE